MVTLEKRTISYLLAKLKTLGVGCTALEWFGSYLSGLQQYVRIGAEALSLGALSHGVPQGSILGPALFTNNINFPTSRNLVPWNQTLSFSVKDTYSVVQQMNDDYRRLRLDAAIVIIYLTIIPRGRVGNEMIDRQRGA